MAIKFLNDISVDPDVTVDGFLYVNTSSQIISGARFNLSGDAAISGNLGIGVTSSNNERLHVRGSSAAVQIVDSSFSGQTSVVFGGAMNSEVSSLSLDTSSNLKYVTGTRASGTTRFLIKSNGNVGIGTTSPDYTLDVAGNAGFNEYLYHNGDSDTYIRFLDNNIYLTAGSGGALQASSSITYLQAFHEFHSDGDAMIGDHIGINGGMSVRVNSAASNVTVSSSAGFDFLYVDSTKSYFQTKLGVNTTSPRTMTDINGPLAVIGGTFTSGTSGADSNNSTGIVLRRGKRIFSGIPSGGNQDFYLRNLIEHDASNNINIGQTGTSLIGNVTLSTGTSGNVIFNTTGSESMRINSSGNVGIATSSPSQRLEVDGNAKADAFIGQRVIVVGSAYHGVANSVYALYTSTAGMTSFISNGCWHSYAPIIMPFNGVVEKVIIKNIKYSSYKTGPSASGTAQIQLSQYDSSQAPMDYSSGNVSFTAAANVSMTFNPNQSYNEGTHFRVFFNSSAIWRYVAYQIVLKQTS